MISVSELARRTNEKPITLWNMIKAGRLPAPEHYGHGSKPKYLPAEVPGLMRIIKKYRGVNDDDLLKLLDNLNKSSTSLSATKTISQTDVVGRFTEAVNPGLFNIIDKAQKNGAEFYVTSVPREIEPKNGWRQFDIDTTIIVIRYPNANT